MIDVANCMVCKTRPAKGKTCMDPACIRRWNDYLNATPMPRQEHTTYAQADEIENVNDTGDYRPPVKKPRAR